MDPPASWRNEQWAAHNRLLFEPGRVRTAIGDADLDTTGIIQAQLRDMFGHGQRKITLLLYFSAGPEDCMFLVDQWGDHCHGDAAYPGAGAWGYVIVPDHWQLAARQRRNLARVLREVVQIGYNQVNLRFIPATPQVSPIYRWWCGPEWTPEQQARVDSIWRFQASVMDETNRALAGTGVSPVYDLGGDLAGWQRDPRNSDVMNGCSPVVGHTRQWMRTIWQRYICRDAWPHTSWTRDSALAHTVGFSFANRIRYAGGSHRETITDHVIDVYDYASLTDPGRPDRGYRCGGRARPGTLAFDLSPGVAGVRGPREFFDEAARQLVALGAPDYPFALFEAPYDNRAMADAIAAARQRTGINLRYVMQWLGAEDGPGQDFNLTYAPRFGCYLPVRRDCSR